MFPAIRPSTVRYLWSISRSSPVCGRRASSQAARVVQTDADIGASRPRRQHSDNRRRPAYDGPKYTLRPGDSIQTVNYHLGRAARSLEFVETFELLAAMRRQGMQPTLETYYCALLVLAENELAEEAVAILADMEAVGLRPTVRIFNLVLQATMPHPQAHAHAKARMEAAHVRPNAETYDFVLGQWVEHRNLEMCLQDLQNMFHAGVAPTMTSMSKVVTLAADTGRPRLALDLINAYEAGEVERLPPGVWLHVLISSVEEHFDAGIERALHKCEKVAVDEGVLMDIIHFATRCGNLPLVQKSLADLTSKGVPLQEHHYAPLIELHCAEKNFTDALAVFQTMRQNDITPTPGSAVPLRDALSNDWDNIDSTWRIVEAARDRGEELHLAVLNAFLRAARRKNDLHRAVGFYRAFPSFGVPPDVTTLTLLVRNCGETGNETLGNELWDELVAGGVQPDHAAYSAMIDLTTQSVTDYEAGFHWLEEMKSKGITPSRPLYEHLVRRLARRRDPRADMALQELQDQGYEVSGDLRRLVENKGRYDKTPPSEDSGSPRRRNDRMVHDKMRAFLAVTEVNKEPSEVEESRTA